MIYLIIILTSVITVLLIQLMVGVIPNQSGLNKQDKRNWIIILLLVLLSSFVIEGYACYEHVRANAYQQENEILTTIINDYYE